jgi:long-chain fatty acid transport protein
MIGFGIDTNPVPERTLGFELPDSDAKLYSIGFRYQKAENLELGMAYLYDHKEDRHVINSSINGEFEDATAHLFTIGFRYIY